MPIFTAAATFLLAETALAGTFAVTALATGLSLTASVGLSYAAKALAGTPAAASNASSHFSTQGTLASGGDVARSFNLGYSMTAGSLVYANTSGGDTTTPNAYLHQVIAVSDMPGGTLQQIWVNGALCTLDGVTHDVGQGVNEYKKDGKDFLYIKYYDGTQTVADPFLVSTFGSDANRPYTSTRVGKGIAYVIATSLVEDTLFTGFPTFKFALSGMPLYDLSKDSTNGGSGSHRFSDTTTWGGDGDNLPVVQVYNILRGIRYNGTWLYGLQTMTAARLPSVNWIPQITKCRATVTGESGAEPTYRSGGQIQVSGEIATAVETILTACQGRMSEIGGFYKIHVGAPDSPTFSFTDDDLLSTEQQVFKPFFALANSVNGIQGTYPDPAQAWATATAAPYLRTDLEVLDGNRRLLANPSFDFVPYKAQVQRLQKSAVEEAQRARSHTISFPPSFWAYLEPGEVGTWTSTRNGYTSKSFRVDGAVDKANLDVTASITEVDPADYSWTHATDFVPVTSGPTEFPRPAAQGVLDWAATPYTLADSDGLGRRPAIRLTWDGTQPGVVGVQYEVRLTSDASSVTRGRTDQLAAGAIIVSQSLIPNTAYQVRGQYLPSSPRDMLWSSWLDVTTPNVLLEIPDVGPAILYNITTLQDLFAGKQEEFEQRFATLNSKIAAQQWTDTRSVRSQLSSRSDAAFAFIEDVQTVSVSADAALASDILTVSAQVNDPTTGLPITHAAVVTNATAISTLNTAFSSYQVTVTATYATLAGLATTNSNVSTNATAIASLAGSLASYETIVAASATYATLTGLATTNASVTTNSSAIATLTGYAGAEYAVTLNVNGYATGFNFFNGGGGISTFTVVSDKIQFQHPSVNGGTPVPFLTLGTIGGVAAMGFSGNFTVDGYVLARMVAANQIQTTHLAATSVTAGKMAANSVTAANAALDSLVVKTFNIGDAAVTAPDIGILASNFTGTGVGATIFNPSFTIDSTGLGTSKFIYVSVDVYCPCIFSAVNISHATTLFINGTLVASPGFVSGQYFSISGALKIATTNGVQTITISFNWNSPNTGQLVAGSSIKTIAVIR